MVVKCVYIRDVKLISLYNRASTSLMLCFSLGYLPIATQESKIMIFSNIYILTDCNFLTPKIF